ncbi:MAG: hypothetical protein HPY57_13000 [Ignavibacteria bacterium]|nr:hypothetical protein [Ignavibacteria bacterium]
MEGNAIHEIISYIQSKSSEVINKLQEDAIRWQIGRLDFSEWLDDIADLYRRQFLTGVTGTFKTGTYEFLVYADSRVSIYINTDGEVMGMYDNFQVTTGISDPITLRFLEELFDYLENIYMDD